LRAVFQAKASRLLLESNTLQQPFPEELKRPKRQQMLDFFASPPGWRDPDWFRVSKIHLQPEIDLPVGHTRSGWFFGKRWGSL
jgi:hypothetical protein